MMSPMRTRIPPLAALFFAGFSAACTNAPRLEASPTPQQNRAPVFATADVIGANSGELDALFGAPALTRREGEGEFRRYSMSSCELLVVLTPGTDGVERVVHLDAAARQSGQEKPTVENCLAAG